MTKRFILAVFALVAFSNNIVVASGKADPKDSANTSNNVTPTPVIAAVATAVAAVGTGTPTASAAASSAPTSGPASSDASASNNKSRTSHAKKASRDDSNSGDEVEIDAQEAAHAYNKSRQLVLHSGNNRSNGMALVPSVGSANGMPNLFQLNVGGSNDNRTPNQKRADLDVDADLAQRALDHSLNIDSKNRERLLKHDLDRAVAKAANDKKIAEETGKTEAETMKITFNQQIEFMERQHVAIARAKVKAEQEAEAERTFGSTFRKSLMGGLEKGVADGIAQPIAHGITVGAIVLGTKVYEVYESYYPNLERRAYEKAEAQKKGLMFGLKLSEQQSRVLQNESISLKNIIEAMELACKGANPKVAQALREQSTMMIAMQMQKQMAVAQMGMQQEQEADEAAQAAAMKAADAKVDLKQGSKSSAPAVGLTPASTASVALPKSA